MTSVTSTVLVETQATDAGPSVGIVTLHDPDRRNALRTDMVDALIGAFDELEEKGDVGAVIVTGSGQAFCAGADLGNLAAHGQVAEESRREGMVAIYQGFLRVARSPLPTLAAVNGPAIGAGMNLALSCDLRLAGRRARFDSRFLQLGLHPGGGHTWMLERAVGPQMAAAMVLFGEVVGAEDAERLGLVWRAVPDDQLMGAAMALATKAAAAPPQLVRRAKKTLQAMPAVQQHAEAVELELGSQLWSLGQPFFAERLAALRASIGGR